MSGKQAKRDRKVAKLGADLVMQRTQGQWLMIIKQKPRWMPGWVWKKMINTVLNTNQIPQ